jgi:hypothetical protein
MDVAFKGINRVPESQSVGFFNRSLIANSHSLDFLRFQNIAVSYSGLLHGEVQLYRGQDIYDRSVTIFRLCS